MSPPIELDWRMRGPKRPGFSTDSRRLWGRATVAENGCWLWMGAADNGYGRIRFGGRKWPAARLAYVLVHGAIADELDIDHLCRTPRCINPDHLEPVTPKENTLRGVGPTAIRARMTVCKFGHPFTPENTAYNYRGYRRCLTCRRRETRESRRRQRARAKARKAASA